MATVSRAASGARLDTRRRRQSFCSFWTAPSSSPSNFLPRLNSPLSSCRCWPRPASAAPLSRFGPTRSASAFCSSRAPCRSSPRLCRRRRKRGLGASLSTFGPSYVARAGCSSSTHSTRPKLLSCACAATSSRDAPRMTCPSGEQAWLVASLTPSPKAALREPMLQRRQRRRCKHRGGWQGFCGSTGTAAWIPPCSRTYSRPSIRPGRPPSSSASTTRPRCADLAT